ncbi:hypothetical protein SAMN05444158_3065 [Bradyrhizobium canariense]|uniref:Uncharacterized protein n=1 Tax=Bradyrhizobium canariense TaxID=255045 RepID=A0A1H1UQQ5_9BRAD|nr:hypothetical protein SAMN05444158_3065 [Bradyrhizobium canariense]
MYTFAKWGPTPSLSDCWGRPEAIRRPSQRRFSWDLAQAARSPGSAATRASHAARAGTEPEATNPAAAATTAAAATSAANKPATAATTEAAAPATTPAAAAPAATSTTATTASARKLHAAANVFPIEEMERGETDVGHFLFAKNEALIGRGIARLRDTGSGHRGCGCTTHQRKTQSGGTQHLHGGGFSCAFLLRSLLDPSHGRILRKFL